MMEWLKCQKMSNIFQISVDYIYNVFFEYFSQSNTIWRNDRV